MKKSILLLFVTALLFSACGDDDNNNNDTPDQDTNPLGYSAVVMQPSADTKRLDDEIHIHTVFESSKEETIHHVKVRIYNKADNTEVYNKPDMAHVHDESGKFELHDDLKLSTENGFSSNSEWVLETKVWGHDGGASEVVESISFMIE